LITCYQLNFIYHMIILWGIVTYFYYEFFLFPFIYFDSENIKVIEKKIKFIGLRKSKFLLGLFSYLLISILIMFLTQSFISVAICLFILVWKFYFKVSKAKKELKIIMFKEFKLIDFYPHLNADLNYEIAKEYFQEKNYSGAIAISDYYIFRKRKVSSINIHNFYELRAKSLQNLGHYIDAIEDYKICLSFNRSLADYHGALAMCYFNIGYWEECMSHLKVAYDHKHILYSGIYEMYSEADRESIDLIKAKKSDIKSTIRRFNYSWVDCSNSNLIGIEENNWRQAKIKIQKYLEFEGIKNFV
jgi:tetratricopeptide (TPR) repeat protein